MNTFKFFVQIKTGNQWQTAKVYNTMPQARAYAKELGALYPMHEVKIALILNR